MEVPPIVPILVRATPIDGAVLPERPIQFVVGQRLSAVVAEVLRNGEALIDAANLRMVARSTVPLTAGEQLELEVVRAGTEIQLRVVASRASAPDAQRAVATLYQARLSAPATSQPANAPPDAALREAVARLAEATAAPLAASDQRQLAQLLAAIPADLPAARLAAAVRALVEHGGAFVESRLQAALSALPPDGVLSSLPPGMAADLRVLLGVLARNLVQNARWASPAPGAAMPAGPAVDGRTAWPATAPDLRAPTSDPVAQRQAASAGALTAPQVSSTTRQEAGGSDAVSAPGAAPETGAPRESGASDLLARLTDQVLAQQLDLALQWIREAVLQTHVPVRFAEQESPVRLRVLRDAPRDPALTAPGGAFQTFEILLELPELGRVDARVQWAGRELAARFFVEHEAVVPLFEAELAPLARGLNDAGFATVTTEVRVDAARILRSGRTEVDPPPGGSLLKVRG